DRVVVDRATEARAHWNDESEPSPVRELSRHHAVVAHAGGQRVRIQSTALHRKPHREHGSENEPGHDGWAHGRILVRKRKDHGGRRWRTSPEFACQRESSRGCRPDNEALLSTPDAGHDTPNWRRKWVSLLPSTGPIPVSGANGGAREPPNTPSRKQW